MFDEASLIAERENQRHATEATLIQLAIGSVMSKDGIRLFNKTLKKMTGG